MTPGSGSGRRRLGRPRGWWWCLGGLLYGCDDVDGRQVVEVKFFEGNVAGAARHIVTERGCSVAVVVAAGAAGRVRNKKKIK